MLVQKNFFNRAVKFKQFRPISNCHVINLIDCLQVFNCSGKKIGLYYILDITKVPARFPIPVNENILISDHAGKPFWDDCGIGPIWILPGPKHIEITQANGIETIATGKYVGIQLVDVLGHCVGTQGFADGVLHLGQTGVIAVGGAAGGVGEAFDFCIAGGHQHV